MTVKKRLQNNSVIRYHYPTLSVKKQAQSGQSVSSVTQLCPTLCDPTNHSTPGLPVHRKLPEFLKLMSIESVMPSNHLILCQFPSPPAPNPSQHQGLFQ